MQPFSEYLKQNHLEKNFLLLPTTRVHYVQTWLSQIRSQLQNLVQCFPSYYKTVTKGLERWLQQHLKHWEHNNLDDKIAELDLVLHQIFFTLGMYAVNQSYLKPISPHLKYPYSPKHSGVSMAAYLVKQKDPKTNKRNIIPTQYEAHDLLQIKAQAKKPKQYQETILSALGTSSLTAECIDLIKSRNSHFHAEDYWFTVEFPKLLDDIELHKAELSTPATQPSNFWLSHMSQYPRLEFLMTSSPCMDCQKLFMDMRRILNQKKLYLPIIIFANSPYQTEETKYGSPIIIVDYEGKYFVTGLTANLPYVINANKVRRQGIINQSLYARLMSADEMTIATLERTAHEYMPLLVTAPPALQNHLTTVLFDLMQSLGGGSRINWPTFAWLSTWLSRLPQQLVDSLTMPEMLDILGRGKSIPEIQAQYDENRAIMPAETDETQPRLNNYIALMFKRLLCQPPVATRYISWNTQFGDKPESEHPLSFGRIKKAPFFMNDEELLAKATEVCLQERSYYEWVLNYNSRKLEAHENTRLERLRENFQAEVKAKFEFYKNRVKKI